jgi:formylglycine-generating enzyme required for sulfatase activity
MSRSPRAALLRAQRAGVDVDAVAAGLGLVRIAQVPDGAKLASSSTAPGVVDPQDSGQIGPHVGDSDDAPVIFHRLSEMNFFDDDEAERAATPVNEGLTQEDLQRPAGVERPVGRALERWSRLWPDVFTALAIPCVAPVVDVDAVVRRLARGQTLRWLPRLARRSWPERVRPILDTSVSMRPFAEDAIDLVERLRKVLGPRMVRPIRLAGGDRAERRLQGPLLRALNGESVLVVSDLARHRWDPLQRHAETQLAGGTVDADVETYPEALAWDRALLRLRRAGLRVVVLFPGGAPSHVRDGRGAPLLEWGIPRRRSARQTPRQLAGLTDRLLTLAAPAAQVEPELLRELRLLLPEGRSVPEVEALAYGHPDVSVAAATAIRLDPAATRRRMEAFVRLDPAIQARVSNLLARWHAHHQPALRHKEALLWAASVTHVGPPGPLPDAEAFFRRLLTTTSCRGRILNVPTDAVRDFAVKMTAALPAAAYRYGPVGRVLQEVWARSHRIEQDTPVPEGVDAAIVAAAIGDVTSVVRWWAVRQVGGELVLSPRDTPMWPSDVGGPGSPVAWLLARGLTAVVTQPDGVRRPTPLESGLRLPLAPERELVIETPVSRIVIAPVSSESESWADHGIGRDRFGLYGDAEICGVTQRFRWIPPGRFWMGSPENEAGPKNNEWPRHRVTLSHGYWLADTQVTQALWEAVMIENPSRFRTLERPVECITWHDVGRFVGEANREAPGLGLRRPTEAEWECACRAGTEGATWIGDLTLLGENNAPELEGVAWYGGNSGDEFELANGADAEGWPNKAHVFAKAGTHPVKRKGPNPFGLFDVLGNVWEWCEDRPVDYPTEPSIDPPVRTNVDGGAARAVRGGSWNGYAPSVRAASRDVAHAEFANAYLGFRLARGHGPQSGAEPAPVERPAPATRIRVWPDPDAPPDLARGPVRRAPTKRVGQKKKR